MTTATTQSITCRKTRGQDHRPIHDNDVLEPTGQAHNLMMKSPSAGAAPSLGILQENAAGDDGNDWDISTLASRGSVVGSKSIRHQARVLLSWTDLPEWQRLELSYVQSGYRNATPSGLQCVKSWLYLHNESVNIFSHLLGAILFLVLPLVIYSQLGYRYTTASTEDAVVMAIYPLGVATCFVLSAMFHTLISHSAGGFKFGRQLDFQGIIVLMWSASVPLVYYTFYTEPRLQRTYWSLTTCSALLASITTYSPFFSRPRRNLLRTGIFGSLALSTLMCIVHGVVKHGWEIQSGRFPMWSIGLTGLFNALGAVLYVIRFPERWWPRRFDIFGASHQLMHWAIVIAGLAWLVGTVQAFDAAHSNLGQ